MLEDPPIGISSLDTIMLTVLSNPFAIFCFVQLIGASYCLAVFRSSKSQRPQPHLAEDCSSERTVVILFHKPPKVLTSHLSEDSRKTVYDEVESMKGFLSGRNGNQQLSFQQATGIHSRLHSVGRLDADTSGLLLLTNDGGLIHHVSNPNARTHTQGAITKTYEALIMGHHDENSLKTLWEGVDIGAKYGGMTKPVHSLQIMDHPNHKSTVVSLSISEGKNRQVRRMFHALGSGVMQLKRTHVGESLTLDGVEEGQWRIMMDQEVRNSLHWEPRNLLEASLAKKRFLRHEKVEQKSKANQSKNGRRRRR